MTSYDKDITADNKLDLQKFNLAFEKEKDLVKYNNKISEKDKLSKFQTATAKKSLSELSIFEILIGIKDTWFDLIDDLLQKQFNATTFTKNNRLFYIGVTIIVIIIILYLYDMMSETEEPENKRIVEVRHIYKLDNDVSGNTILKLAQSANDTKIINDLARDVVVLNTNSESDF